MRKRMFIVLMCMILVIAGVMIAGVVKTDKREILEQNEEIKENLISLIEEKVESKEYIFNMEDATDFKWDSMIIVTPYSPICKMSENNEIPNIKRISTMIEWNDCINLILFLREGEILEYTEFPRNRGDFSTCRNTGLEYTSEEAKFKIQMEEEWINIVPIE